MSWNETVKIEEFIGKTFSDIVGKVGDDELIFVCNDGTKYKMFHYQDCCETVYLEDINGDLADLLNSPIIDAREETNNENPKEDYEASWTWTFYHLATIKGSVVLRWYGSSNGYYSEGVEIEKVA